MRQPDIGARDTGLDAGWGRSGRPAAGPAGAPTATDGDQEQALPPGQYVPRKLPVLHYGRVPCFKAQTWDLRVCGATRVRGRSGLDLARVRQRCRAARWWPTCTA